MNQLINFFQDKRINKIIDIGTGSGDFINVLKDAFPKTKITGIDPSPEALAKAKEVFPEVEFREMVSEKLSFPGNSFDVASISMALHHLKDVKKSFSEMMRVVKPGGWIIVNELFSDNLNKAQEVHKLYHHFRSTTDRILGVSHNETFKKNEIIQMVKESGIDIDFHFEFDQDKNLISKPEDLDERVQKMRDMLEKVKNFPEYETLKPKIKEFKEKAAKYGFQPATRVIIVGRTE